jgi:hypothetical protein
MGIAVFRLETVSYCAHQSSPRTIVDTGRDVQLALAFSPRLNDLKIKADSDHLLDTRCKRLNS